jgi:arsenite methyltransferase
MNSGTVDYGIDAPGIIRNMSLGGMALIALAGTLPASWLNPATLSITRYVLFFWGLSFVLTSFGMLLYAKSGKFRHRDRILNFVSWKGNERVLDIGTGRGLLMIGAAKRLQSGKAFGIDIWNAEDLSNNSLSNARKNVDIEGVADKVELLSEDARKMSFPDASFDVILSNLCIHNLYQAAEREEACREIARVLKPGGTALISDFRHTNDYAKSFRQLGLETEILGPFWKDTFPKLSIVRVKKA